LNIANYLFLQLSFELTFEMLQSEHASQMAQVRRAATQSVEEAAAITAETKVFPSTSKQQYYFAHELIVIFE
jgi:hypothetical protein